jgi:hypothetical protein
MDPRAEQRLIQMMDFQLSRDNFTLQMEVMRFWSEEIAKPRHADPKRLARYGFKTYCQNDEDGIIQEIFRRIEVKHRTFIEFGVETGIECNTAKLLIEGWRGLWIEGNPQHGGQIRKNLDAFRKDGRLKLTEGMVTAENVNALFGKAGFSGEIDLLSIDIDFNDYWVWKAIEVVTPRAVVIEYNAIIRPPHSLVGPYEATRVWDGSNYGGASLEAMVRLGRAKGYRIVGCSLAGSNAFFVRDDLCGDRFLDPPTAEEHYEPTRFFLMFLPAGLRPRVGPYVEV